MGDITSEKRQYQHSDGRIFSVGIGLPKGSPGGKWTTYWRWPDVGGSTRHVCKALPWRDTEDEAQADLDAWAKRYQEQHGTPCDSLLEVTP